MWWLLKKLSDDSKTVVYAYSKESRDLDGIITCEIPEIKMVCTKLSSGDDENSVKRFFSSCISYNIQRKPPR